MSVNSVSLITMSSYHSTREGERLTLTAGEASNMKLCSGQFRHATRGEEA
jgi:hypothetical protein